MPASEECAPGLSAWRFVGWFGVVSLLADLVYEGARSVTGPFLASLGASALTVGIVTGVGETFALAGRLGTGPVTDRTRAYWPLTVAGYALTVVSVPLLGWATWLWAASVLVVLERAGKAVRSPAKDVMLSHAAAAVGRGRGFAVHEALDQIGAVAGPLLVAAVLAARPGGYRAAFAMLAVPGVLVVVLLLRLRTRVPDPSRYETSEQTTGTRDGGRERLPRVFWTYLGFTVLTTAGYATFGVLAFHLASRDLVPAAVIPVVYAAAMGVDAAVAVATGWAYDRIGRRILIAVPILTALIPVLAFSDHAEAAIAGVLVWGAVLGVSESTMRAAIADLVPTARRGTAYGIFAAGYGAATLVGAVLSGGLYAHSQPTLIAIVAVLQISAMALLLATRPSRTDLGSAKA